MSGATKTMTPRRRGLASLHPSRCGVCDRPSTLAYCDACEEPTCAEHLTSRVVAGVRVYVCTLCAVMQAEESTAATRGEVAACR